MSLRRSSRRSCGDGGDAAIRRREFVVGNTVEVGVTGPLSFGPVGDQDTFRGKSIHGNHGPNDKSTSCTRPKRLFVGDSVEFCPIFTNTKEDSKVIESEVEDANEVAANPAPNSVQTTSALSTDSFVSESSDDDNRLKRKTPSPTTSSSSSLASEADGEKPQKKKGRSLFKRKLRITLKVARKDSESKSESSKDSQKDSIKKSNVHDENQHCNIQKPCANDAGQLTIQQLLSLRTMRSLQTQSNLSLLQLKQQARERARANKPVQPKRKSRSKKGKKQKPKSPASDESETMEPLDKIEMNTGTLYLYRGENRRAKFVWRK